MASHRFYQLDVFTRKPLAGNALAVFPDAAGLDPALMQSLAREMNLSETTFVTASSRATKRVRFFTPTSEIPLAGHPTVGTWWALAERGLIDVPSDGVTTVTQETGAGVLPVEIALRRGAPQRVEMVQATPSFGATISDLDRLSRALGSEGPTVADHAPAQVVSTGMPQTMIPMTSRAALQSLPSGGAGSALIELLRTVGSDCAMCFALAHEGGDGEAALAHCRMFAPGLGVPEDPATGSAAGALGAYLVRHGLIRSRDGVARLIVEQGLEIGRPSRIEVTVAADGGDVTEVRVGGQAITVIEGEVRL